MVLYVLFSQSLEFEHNVSRAKLFQLNHTTICRFYCVDDELKYKYKTNLQNEMKLIDWIAFNLNDATNFHGRDCIAAFFSNYIKSFFYQNQFVQ